MRNRDEQNWGLVPCALPVFLVFAATVLARDTRATKARADFGVTNSSNNDERAQQSSYSEDSDRTTELLHFMRSADRHGRRAGDPGVGSSISAGKAVQRLEHIPRLPAYSSEAARAENT